MTDNTENNRPYWWPDAQGACMAAILFMCGCALFIRMFHTSVQEDKMLDTMITILFSTCLVGVVNYLFGSSRGSTAKDETINRIASTAQPAAPIAPITTTTTKAGADQVTTRTEPSTAALPSATLGLVGALIIGALLLFGGGDAMAQAKHPQITGNVVADTKANLGIGGSGLTGDPAGDLIAALDAKLLPDLQYSLRLATASGNKVTAPCWQAWISIITIRQDAVKDDQGQPIPAPDPGIITKFEKAVEIRNSLQSDGDFMLKCSPVAAMVKLDFAKFVGLIVSGGAGLAALGL